MFEGALTLCWIRYSICCPWSASDTAGVPFSWACGVWSVTVPVISIPVPNGTAVFGPVTVVALGPGPIAYIIPSL